MSSACTFSEEGIAKMNMICSVCFLCLTLIRPTVTINSVSLPLSSQQYFILENKNSKVIKFGFTSNAKN
jgi:hypothetical protein